jgi:hypothetical protein
MKAKTLLIAAAALAAGVMHSQAQVYSQNIVGYINVPLSTGYNLIANQLDSDGTGTNNNITATVGTNWPTGTAIQYWNPSTASFATTKFLGGKWTANNQLITNSMNPGSGFFMQVSAPTNVTFVGNVITGTNSYPLIAGYQIVAPSGPVSGTIDTTNGYVPSVGDIISVWNNSSSSFVAHKRLNATTWGGTGGDPQLTVGQAVFLDPTSAKIWTQILNVQ